MFLEKKTSGGKTGIALVSFETYTQPMPENVTQYMLKMLAWLSENDSTKIYSSMRTQMPPDDDMVMVYPNGFMQLSANPCIRLCVIGYLQNHHLALLVPQSALRVQPPASPNPLASIWKTLTTTKDLFPRVNATHIDDDRRTYCETSCPICFETEEELKTKMLLTFEPCGHGPFCLSCWHGLKNAWLRGRNEGHPPCPSCRVQTHKLAFLSV